MLHRLKKYLGFEVELSFVLNMEESMKGQEAKKKKYPGA